MLPADLTSYFADSTLTIAAYDAQAETLYLEIEKEIGPESGLIVFTGVALIALPVWSRGDGMDACTLANASPKFFSISSSRDPFDSDVLVYSSFDQDGGTGFVVAKSIEYTRFMQPRVR
ncbi:MAG: hypothetical protein IPK60_07565 [Sandaracinaceae bacterium]|nr:hypothetical protein [Sandaracinaceae bacterium]